MCLRRNPELDRVGSGGRRGAGRIWTAGRGWLRLEGLAVSSTLVLWPARPWAQATWKLMAAVDAFGVARTGRDPGPHRHSRRRCRSSRPVLPKRSRRLVERGGSVDTTETRRQVAFLKARRTEIESKLRSCAAVVSTAVVWLAGLKAPISLMHQRSSSHHYKTAEHIPSQAFVRKCATSPAQLQMMVYDPGAPVQKPQPGWHDNTPPPLPAASPDLHTWWGWWSRAWHPGARQR